MPSPRKFHAMTAWKRKLYVAGGYDDAYSIPRTIDIYDPQLNKWTSEKSGYFSLVNFDVSELIDV